MIEHVGNFFFLIQYKRFYFQIYYFLVPFPGLVSKNISFPYKPSSKVSTFQNSIFYTIVQKTFDKDKIWQKCLEDLFSGRKSIQNLVSEMVGIFYISHLNTNFKISIYFFVSFLDTSKRHKCLKSCADKAFAYIYFVIRFVCVRKEPKKSNVLSLSLSVRDISEFFT